MARSPPGNARFFEAASKKAISGLSDIVNGLTYFVALFVKRPLLNGDSRMPLEHIRLIENAVHASQEAASHLWDHATHQRLFYFW
ncbi:hypothetical protein [Paraburkholderia aspalathi]|uniref:Uncharacterized protein n=1 Tax=Paraburkholderia aspalathi TaxID=1324617 RepID=A0A1I7EJL2_9BURK|nr:hypothetical protein [Paraburkholderia aspalathi]SFU24106.1 hypothetical protein SAMN05192563_1024176 [Paraburkholderia aspalathi]